MSKDGGPAFPCDELINTREDMLREGSAGMSLRDWFAGQALAGLLANSVLATEAARKPPEDFHAFMAASVYKFADAMLAERKK